MDRCSGVQAEAHEALAALRAELDEGRAQSQAAPLSSAALLAAASRGGHAPLRHAWLCGCA
jgi:hypothetical protein